MIRPMTLADLQLVLDWATDEGWNPGLDDAPAFYAADPTGFLIKEVDEQPVAAISVVNHDPDYAFLGLYICKPACRGQGHGIDVWHAGLAHAGGRCIGLDGVPDQQANYASAGFVIYGSSVRFEGQIAAAADDRLRLALPADIAQLAEQDRAACGIDRRAFADAWFSQTPRRQTIVIADGPEVTGFATHRRCQSGVKVGPLYARSQADAQALLAARPLGPSPGPTVVDTTGSDTALAQLLKDHNFTACFETARMFKEAAPVCKVTEFQAIATMELG